MSKKRKNKKRQFQKQSKAKHINHWKKAFSKICMEFNIPELSEHLTPKDWTIFYRNRMNKPRCEFANREVEKNLSEGLKMDELEYVLEFKIHHWIPEAPEISFSEFMEMGMQLIMVLELIKKGSTDNPKLNSSQVTEKYDTITKICDDMQKHLDFLISFVSVGLTEYNKYYRWYKYKLITRENSAGEKFSTYTFFLHHKRVKSKMVILDGVAREIFPFGFVFAAEGFKKLIITAESLYGVPDINEEFPVFIQSHALIRLKERLDVLENWMIYTNLYQSLLEWKAVRKRIDTWLVEFSVPEAKLGYILLTAEKNMLIIRTFLLLTSRGTPEGDKLSEKVGLYNHDITYLNLDKLSTFVQPDIRENKFICKLLREAECEGLLDIKPENCMLKNTQGQASYIADYIGRKEELVGHSEADVLHN